MLEDKEAIREVLYRYCYGTDTGDTEGWVRGFTEDCLWDGGPFGVCQGKDAMRAFHKEGGDAAKSMRHLTLNSLIDVQGDDARAVSYVFVFGVSDAGTSVVFSGFYEDVLIRKGSRWLIQARKLRPDMSEIRLPS
jgi:ketosteroid isomerase-like protein